MDDLKKNKEVIDK